MHFRQFRVNSVASSVPLKLALEYDELRKYQRTDVCFFFVHLIRTLLNQVAIKAHPKATKRAARDTQLHVRIVAQCEHFRAYLNPELRSVRETGARIICQ